MKISDVMDSLQVILEIEGDIEVVNVEDDNDRVKIQYGKEFHVIGIPNEHTEEIEYACGFINSLDFQDELQQAEVLQNKNHLTLIKEEE